MSSQRSALLRWMLRSAATLFLGSWVLLGWRLIVPPVTIPLPANPAFDMVLCARGRLDHAGPRGSCEVGEFWIDRFEVTCSDYAEWLRVHPERVDVTRGLTPEQLALTPDQPVTRVCIKEAEAFAASRGKRLPSLMEWEWAATGPRNRRYPWGDAEPLAVPANLSESGLAALAPVGTFEGGRSEFGAYDLAGNAAEWTHSTWGGAVGQRYFAKGGSYLDALRDRSSGVSALDSFRPEDAAWQPVEGRLFEAGAWSSDIGFRCVLDVAAVQEDQALREAAQGLGARDPWGWFFEHRPALAHLRSAGERALPYLVAAMDVDDGAVAETARRLAAEIRGSVR